MSFWGEHSVHTVYCDLNWLAKQIKIIKINNIFFFKKSCHFGGEHSVHTVYCDLNWLATRMKIIKINNNFFHFFFSKNHVILGGTLSPYSVL